MSEDGDVAKTTAAISTFWSHLSEKWQAVGAMLGIGSMGVVLGATGMGIWKAPAVARANADSIEVVMPLVRENTDAIRDLQIVDDERDEQMVRVERRLDFLALGQCLLLTESRGRVPDECRLILDNGDNE